MSETLLTTLRHNRERDRPGEGIAGGIAGLQVRDRHQFFSDQGNCSGETGELEGDFFQESGVGPLIHSLFGFIFSGQGRSPSTEGPGAIH